MVSSTGQDVLELRRRRSGFTGHFKYPYSQFLRKQNWALLAPLRYLDVSLAAYLPVNLSSKKCIRTTTKTIKQQKEHLSSCCLIPRSSRGSAKTLTAAAGTSRVHERCTSPNAEALHSLCSRKAKSESKKPPRVEIGDASSGDHRIGHHRVI